MLVVLLSMRVPRLGLGRAFNQPPASFLLLAKIRALSLGVRALARMDVDRWSKGDPIRVEDWRGVPGTNWT